MAKKATKEAISYLQKVFDFLGEFGGTIETKNPENWWKLDLEVESVLLPNQLADVLRVFQQFLKILSHFVLLLFAGSKDQSSSPR